MLCLKNVKSRNSAVGYSPKKKEKKEWICYGFFGQILIGLGLFFGSIRVKG